MQTGHKVADAGAIMMHECQEFRDNRTVRDARDSSLNRQLGIPNRIANVHT
jgi:hypothetical protein